MQNDALNKDEKKHIYKARNSHDTWYTRSIKYFVNAHIIMLIPD